MTAIVIVVNKTIECKICPFCGSEDLMMRDHDEQFSVNCLKCYCRGPVKDDQEIAIKAWNNIYE